MPEVVGDLERIIELESHNASLTAQCKELNRELRESLRYQVRMRAELDNLNKRTDNMRFNMRIACDALASISDDALIALRKVRP